VSTRFAVSMKEYYKNENQQNMRTTGVCDFLEIVGWRGQPIFLCMYEFTTFSINKSAARQLKKPLLLFIMPFLRLLPCVFLIVSALLFRPVKGATSTANPENDGPLPIAGRDRTKQRKNLVDTAGETITATIGFKSSVGPSSLEALPQGVVILYRYIYIDAIVVEMDTTLVSTLIQDDNIAYVEQDSLMYPMAETIPWGIPAIQANDVTVPAPDPSAPCFTICVVDSGFSVGHEDLVCNCTNPSRCLLSFHLASPDFGIVAVFYCSWEYCWKRVWNPGRTDVVRARTDCLSWNTCSWNDHCPGWK
jgi:hypothetical protein